MSLFILAAVVVAAVVLSARWHLRNCPTCQAQHRRWPLPRNAH